MYELIIAQTFEYYKRWCGYWRWLLKLEQSGAKLAHPMVRDSTHMSRRSCGGSQTPRFLSQ